MSQFYHFSRFLVSMLGHPICPFAVCESVSVCADQSSLRKVLEYDLSGWGYSFTILLLSCFQTCTELSRSSIFFRRRWLCEHKQNVPAYCEVKMYAGLWVWVIYLQSVTGQGLGSFHDDLLNPLNWQVTSCLLQTLTEEANHLMVRWEEKANQNTEVNSGLVLSKCTYQHHSSPLININYKLNT